VVLGVNLVSMGVSWGYSSTSAAGLASAMSALGIVGSVLFGLLADRLGGARVLALMAFDQMVLWGLFLLHEHLPYPALVAIVGLIGMHGAGAIPSMSKAFADIFGAATFSRAFGLSATVVLPLMIVGIVGTARVGHVFGSYSPAIMGMMIYLALCTPAGLLASRRIFSQTVLGQPTPA
jgi:MFS family permease